MNEKYRIEKKSGDKWSNIKFRLVHKLHFSDFFYLPSPKILIEVLFDSE